MADVHTAEQRSRNMSAIRGRNTKPEVALRSALHRLGFRFRIHRKDLPGNPDILLPKYRAAIFVNGCFWHGHHCHLFKWPKTRKQFWRDKIGGNAARDARNRELLEQRGYRVLTVWECALKGTQRLHWEELIALVADWIRNGPPAVEITGRPLN